MILVFNHNIGEAITSAAEINCDDDGYILAKAANILRMYVGHNYWINFRVDGFSLELIFAWICFHELLILGIVRGFIFANGWYFLCNVLELEDTFYFFGAFFVKAKFLGEASLKNKFTSASIFMNWWISRFYVDLILRISRIPANKSAQNISQRKDWSTRKLIHLRYLSGSRFDRHCIKNVFTKRHTLCLNSLFWKEMIICTSLRTNLMVLKFFHQITCAFNLVCLNFYIYFFSFGM